MKKHEYNPEIHHRQSIRLKGHDYSGGGTYFVTICAHRDWVGCIPPVHAPFAMPGLREIIRSEWEKSAALRPYVRLDEFVVMPDHFHALIRLDKGCAPLGEVIGAFKAAVSRRRGEMHLARIGGIWHRNYYERIVRNAEELENVRDYIRMNPWKNIINLGNGMCGIGNPSLLNWEKIGMLCSRNCPEDALRTAQQRVAAYREMHCLISGFHSPPEQAILAALLKSHAKIICCPAWGIDKMKLPADWLPALEQNRMLILEMKNGNADLGASRERNVFVMQTADELWIPHVSPNGMLARLIENLNVQNKIVRN